MWQIKDQGSLKKRLRTKENQKRWLPKKKKNHSRNPSY